MGGAGAATPNGQYALSANGGFIALSALNALGLTGAGSTATSDNNKVSATGTGVCLTNAQGTATSCPAAGTTQTNSTASATANGTTPSGKAGPTCMVPSTSLALVTLEAACGTASAAQDSSGNQTASGQGTLGQITVSLGSVLGTGALSSLPLCGSSGSPGDAITSSVTGLLTSVQTLLGSAGLPSLPTGSLPGLPTTTPTTTTPDTTTPGSTTTPTTTSSTNPLSSLCSVLSGLTSELGPLGSLLSGLTSSSTLLSITPGNGTSAIATTKNAAGDQVETATSTTEGIDLNILGLLDVQLSPNTASITMDTTTGTVSNPSASTGVLSVAAAGSAAQGLSVPDLSSVLGTLLTALGGSGVIDPSLATIAQSSTSTAPDGHSGSAKSADLKLSLMGGMVVLNLGDAEVTATDDPSVPVTAAAVTPVVQGVTTVHTGEFWAGTLPIVLASGMAAGGLLLIGRRRVAALARQMARSQFGRSFSRHS
jgi:hypothetical protein